MRVVIATVDTPRSVAWALPTAIVEAVQAAAVPQDELAHAYATLRPGGLGVVIYLLVPLDRAAATGSRLVLAALDALGVDDWTLGEIMVLDPADLS